jgi:surface protein
MVTETHSPNRTPGAPTASQEEPGTDQSAGDARIEQGKDEAKDLNFQSGDASDMELANQKEKRVESKGEKKDEKGQSEVASSVPASLERDATTFPEVKPDAFPVEGSQSSEQCLNDDSTPSSVVKGSMVSSTVSKQNGKQREREARSVAEVKPGVVTVTGIRGSMRRSRQARKDREHRELGSVPEVNTGAVAVEGIQSSQQSQTPSSAPLSERQLKERMKGRMQRFGQIQKARKQRQAGSVPEEMTGSASVEGSQSSEPPLESGSKPPSVTNLLSSESLEEQLPEVDSSIATSPQDTVPDVASPGVNSGDAADGTQSNSPGSSNSLGDQYLVAAQLVDENENQVRDEELMRLREQLGTVVQAQSVQVLVSDDDNDSNRKMRRLGICIAVILVVIGVVVGVSLGVGGGDDGDEEKVDDVDDIVVEPSTCFTTADSLRVAVDVYLSIIEHPNITESIRVGLAPIYGWPIGKWCVSNVTDFSLIFSGERNLNARRFNEDLSQWDVSNALDISEMFDESSVFNQNISSWNVSSVMNMDWFVGKAVLFDQDIGLWDTSSVKSMRGMFKGAESFNQDIGGWDTSTVEDMHEIFRRAESFDQKVGGWNTSKVTNMDGLFEEAASFNQDISSWDTSIVNQIFYMFKGATKFNQKIGLWNTSSVITMRGTFQDAESFNQDIGGWDTSNVEDMSDTFHKAESFNNKVSGWNTSKVSNMDGLFEQAASFNQDISSWDIENVESFTSMFSGAKSYQQNLCQWGEIISDDAVVENMFEGTKCASTMDPDLANSPAGPFCAPCGIQ